jgi:hypothetical protein
MLKDYDSLGAMGDALASIHARNVEEKAALAKNGC